MKAIKTLILILFCVNMYCAYSIKPGDNLLVYFSNDTLINRQYYKILKMKFPEMNIIFVSNKEEFDRYIPYSGYSMHTSMQGKPYSLSLNSHLSENKEVDSLQKKQGKLDASGYYFFGIGSETYTGSYYVESPNSWNTYNKTYTAIKHSFRLFHYNNSEFHDEELADLKVRRAFSKETVIPLWEMDQVDDLINPIFVGFFLKQYLKPELFNPQESKLFTCEIAKTDTIYINSLLNRDNIPRQLLPEPKERKFKRKVRCFKHTHIKLTNQELTSRAVSKLNHGEHFYFYYYNSTKRAFYIIDALDFSLVGYTRLKPLKIIFIDIPFRKHVKHFSKFRKRC